MQPHWTRVGLTLNVKTALKTAVAAMVAAVALASGGCYISSTGSAERLAQAPERVPVSYWPTPPTTELNETLFAYPDLQQLGPIVAGVRSTSLGGPNSSRTESLRVHRYEGTIVKLNVDVYGRPVQAPPDLMSLFIGFTPNGYAQTGLTFGTTNERLTAIIRQRDRLATIEGYSSRFVPPPQPFCAPAVVVEERSGYGTGIGFKFPAFIPASPRGVILHLWALGSNPYERDVVAEFRKRGWVVIDIDPDDGIDPDIDESVVSRVLELEDLKAAEAKLVRPFDMRRPFTEQMAVRGQDPHQKEVDRLTAESMRLRNPPLLLRTPADIEPLAQMLASEIDLTLGRNALATEAILDALHTLYPATRTVPTVVVGFSAGALSAPAVVAKMRDKVSAAVLIGGAANLVEVGARSTFYDGGITLETRPLKPGEPTSNRDRPNRPSRELVRQLGSRYLELSKLDPYHTAAALRGMPVLQVHAIWDTWVPADLGELLEDRLGRPDQLWHTGGHGMLFYFLPSQAGWISEWIERAVAAPQAGRTLDKNRT